eukprot:jgi/Botrbrau1/22821/Bobra.0132s0144.1
MVGAKQRCCFDQCKTWAYFNNQGETRGLYCSAHKIPGMVDVVNKLCGAENCQKHPNFNHQGATHALYCGTHKEDGMVNVNNRERQCQIEGCAKYPSCNYPGNPDGQFCGKHKLDGMVNVTSRHCAYEGCIKQPNFHHAGNSRGLYCCEHKEPGMVNVVSKPCQRAGCTKQPSFNYPGNTQGLYCSPHKEPGMVNVKQKHCAATDCSNRPSFNWPGKPSGIYCSMHKAEGMVDVRNKHCLNAECNKCPSFNYPGSTPGIYCGLHKLPGMIDVKHKRSHLSQAQAVQHLQMEAHMNVHSRALEPALDPTAMNLHHLGPVLMHPGMHDPNSAYGPSIGVPTHSYGAALTASMGVTGIPVPGDATTGLVDPTLQSAVLPQDRGGPSAGFSVGEGPGAVSLTRDGLMAVLPHDLTLSSDHLQSVLHSTIPDSHGHGLLNVGDGHAHGMLPVGDGSGVIPGTEADGLMGMTVGHGSTDEMLHMTDDDGIMQQFEHLEPHPNFVDPLESPKAGEPDRKKPRMFDDVKLESANPAQERGL